MGSESLMIKNRIISLPFVGFVIFGIGGILFFCSIFVIENMIGSPSSTSSLIIIPMVPISIISAVFGGVFGYLIEKILRLLKKGNALANKDIYISGLLLSLVIFGIAIFVPLKMQFSWNAHNSPRVIVDTGLIKKFSNNTDAQISNQIYEPLCSVNFDQRQKGKEFYWNEKTYEAKFSEHSFSVIDDTGKTFIKQSLDGYDYIRELICYSFSQGQSTDSLLVVFSDLRATSGNSIIYFYDSNGKSSYQELINGVNAIYMGEDLNKGKSVVIVELINSQKFLYTQKGT